MNKTYKKPKLILINNVANVPSTLKTGLENLGWDVELFHPSAGGSHLNTAQRIILAAKRVKEIFILVARLRRGDHSVIHINYGYYGMIGVLAGKPYHLHCHGTDVRRNLYKFPFSLPTKIALRRAKKVFYSTPDLWEHVRKLRSDAIFIPNPIRTDLFMPGPRIEKRRVLILSRLEPIKGTDLAIRAARTVLHGDVITAVDWGIDAPKYKNDPDVTLRKMCSYNEMPAMLREYDVAIGQLGLGILSMAELEAMAMEIPVLMYYKYPDVYPEQPPIINVEPLEALVISKLKELLSDPDQRQKVGRASRAWVVKYHDVNKICERLDLEYNKIES